MQEDIENTGFVLIRFLRALHVKVSRATVYRLLDNPLGNSLRGMSDTLDTLHIKNSVYQLPTEYFDKLGSPFIAVINDKNSPFCLVERIEEKDITITIPHKHLKVSRQQFLWKWTGGVLAGEVTEKTLQEKACLLKNAAYWVWQHKLLLAGVVAVMLIVMYDINRNDSTGFSIYLITLCSGIFISSLILYKELINNRFLDRFCHVGKVIDCNKVLTSKGAHVMGIRLGEMSLFYFTTLLLFALMRPYDYYGFSLICSVAAMAFTIYSVIYQLFIIRKGCMLCMLVNLAVWSNCITLYLLREQANFNLSIQAASCLMAISFICLLLWLQIKTLLRADEERKLLKDRLSVLFKPEVFWKLLSIKPQMEEAANDSIVLHNDRISKNRLTVLINPNCKNCAKALSSVRDISDSISVSLVFLTFSNDRLGEHVAQIIIAAYQAGGWSNALELLGEWYETGNIKEIDRCDITPEAEEIWKQQQLYCRKQNIDRTPSIFVNEYCVPEIYPLAELKYVLL